MDSVVSIVDGFRRFSQASQDILKDLLDKHSYFSRRNPIEILKRLQRETFSDLMKLRERLEKVERMCTFIKSSKGGLLQEVNTRVKGVVNVDAGLLFVENAHEHVQDMVNRAGINIGINSRFIFETVMREKDTLLTEFMATTKVASDRLLGSSLSLEKLLYWANINDWLSMIGIPMGALCNDFQINPSHLHGAGLTKFSFGPPLFNQYHDCAIGIIVKRTNVIFALAELFSGMSTGSYSVEKMHHVSTFGQAVYQPSIGMQLTLSCLHQTSRPMSQINQLGPWTIPVFWLKSHSKFDPKEDNLDIRKGNKDSSSIGSIAVMLETDFDDSKKVGAWVSLQKSNLREMQWAISFSDTPDNEIGWGITMGGMIEGSSTQVHSQLESFLKISVNERCNFQLGFIFLSNERSKVPGFVVRSSWSL